MRGADCDGAELGTKVSISGETNVVLLSLDACIDGTDNDGGTLGWTAEEEMSGLEWQRIGLQDEGKAGTHITSTPLQYSCTPSTESERPFLKKSGEVLKEQ